MKILSESTVGTANGKIILIGEHAVVHGMPAIALPFEAAQVTVEIEPKNGETTVESSYFTGKLSEVPATLYNFVEALKAVCKYLNQSYEGLKIKVNSLIPSERGMGSSAAVASALVRSIFSYFNKELTKERLFEFVSISEKIAHGNPSGLDALIVSNDHSYYFIKGETPEKLSIDLPGFLIAADTGFKGQTKEAVSDVGQLLRDSKGKTSELIHSIGRLTKKAKRAIEDKDPRFLGELLTKAHEHLTALTVSSEQLDQLVQVALESGALGAKLTGGGRGGCMIALAEKKDEALKIAEKLEKAGAKQTWIHSLGEDAND